MPSAIRVLQVDLTAACNAACLLCSRQTADGRLNPHFPNKRHLDQVTWEKTLADPRLARIEEIFFCGNYGDALASPYLLRLIKIAEKIHGPRLRWNIHTNGSMGSRGTWEELAELTQRAGRLVKFAIDGLEDTNPLYRRGLDWSRIMENCRIFLGAGGRGVWKFIEFEHNAHQIKEAEELARQMGFLRFELRKNYAPHLNPLENSTKDRDENTKVAETGDPRFVACRSHEEGLVYLDFSGHLWPCCWVADWKYSPERARREWHTEKIEKAHGEDFNQLSRWAVKDVLSHPLFSEDGARGWSESLAHPVCFKQCGGCNRESSLLTDPAVRNPG